MEVLKDKQYRDYAYFSRYIGFPIYYNINDRKYVYGITSQIKDNIKYTLHKVKRNDTYDSIALDYYNNPTMYWVICDFNKIQDPYKKPIEGIDLKIPVLSNVSFKEV